MPNPLELLHIHAQSFWHSPAYIVGNTAALEQLRDAITAALTKGKGKTTAFVNDGEGYQITVCRDDSPWDQGSSWWDRETPYTDPIAYEDGLHPLDAPHVPQDREKGSPDAC